MAPPLLPSKGARQALARAIKAMGPSAGRDSTEHLTDMLTDLLTWAHVHEQDFDKALGSARMHFHFEVECPDEISNDYPD